ncbi:MAG TPA: ATP-binding cassette domain-containing protein [Streptosporangiaceae bacterium]|nr:ATP-binding cassette domain-containing protein [Streptosporangiaceae bacterium]
MSECVLRTTDLRKEFGKGDALVRAVDEVSLEVAAAETLAIMGPSGCGKSTLLHLLGGLERASGGSIDVAGSTLDRLGERALAKLRRTAIGFVFQAFHLIDELTARENVELPALLAGKSPRTARRRASELLERVGLADRASFLPAALSGGQRQRVAVARALSNEPLVVLADEPTGNLDSAATLDVLRLFDSLRATGQTLVIVTHDSRIAATADRLISMRDGAFVDETRLTGGTRGNPRRARRAGGLTGHGTSAAHRPARGPRHPAPSRGIRAGTARDRRRHRGADAGPDPARRHRQPVPGHQGRDPRPGSGGRGTWCVPGGGRDAHRRGDRVQRPVPGDRGRAEHRPLYRHRDGAGPYRDGERRRGSARGDRGDLGTAWRCGARARVRDLARGRRG